ncbi:MATE family efflux transporter [Halalkalibacterium halodurans]|uniref:BH2936 protein n=1 Tax=Halalkalibacterium halodurans (strain ATCC BAA-125 / DSM 18197 / FERM 7344 / JCM 9153 / C-125) TaxID=272558 RepID=Q9K8R7_HALH5|nr:MATE family efflux transporter [Halalkalibacterium halodurans]MED4081584.1 MATE family efflux transporter [Halalkalibacterium halodurans]MED4085004.1 MATE family efflux transporter [Halalkalibacterium halodurans]MED4104109.1 MATE family efflux transporter [Halalkalibacterium halodurans]MED4110573.1 MATE family efflux transporter [Halalkalibacterium halodurans]MED4123091.1 MATE family efflux transporter [Halalkalibacterium halodurans]
MKGETKKQLTLFALTWPIFIEILLHMLMGNADTLMLSQYSDDAVAAVGVSNQILAVIIVMFGFVATGTSILVAQHLGAKERENAGKVAVVSIGANLIFGIVLGLLLIAFGPPILKAMQLDDSLLQEATLYLQIVGGFSVVQSLIMTAGAILRSHSFTKDVMYVTIGMNILNVIGNYLFIFGPFGIPVLGVTGVALSTVVSRTIGLFVIAILLYKRIRGELPFAYLLKRFPRVELRNLLKIGIPSAGEQLSYNASQLVITYFIAMMGTEALTTKVYTQNLMMFVFLFAVAIGQGTQILIGHQVGAKQIQAAYVRCFRSLWIAMTVSVSMAVVFFAFSTPLLGIFTDNPDILSLGTTLLLLTIILEPGRACNLVVISSLRAAGDVKFPVYLAIVSMWGIAVPIAYLLGLPLGLGLIGVWIAFIADEWFRGLLMIWRWRKGKWQEMSFVGKKASA